MRASCVRLNSRFALHVYVSFSNIPTILAPSLHIYNMYGVTMGAAEEGHQRTYYMPDQNCLDTVSIRHYILQWRGGRSESLSQRHPPAIFQLLVRVRLQLRESHFQIVGHSALCLLTLVSV